MKQSELENYRANLSQPQDIPSRGRNIALSLALFAIIPGVFFVVALQLTKASGPQWLGSNFENSYTYLFNSLALAIGKPPAQIDHPGTTTQLFGAACLRLSQSASGGPLINAVLEKPEHFLKRMHRALLIASALAICILPLQNALRTHSLVNGLLLQIPVLFFITIFNYSIWYGSDLFLLIPSFAAVSICTLLMKRREEGTANLRMYVFAGVICGFGITTKLTFFPLILVTVFCCRDLKTLLFFASGFAVTCALILIPIYSELPRLFTWILGLATHSGYYGTGEIAFARKDVYLRDILDLLSVEPMVALIPLLSTAAILIAWFADRARNTGPHGRKLARMAVGLLLLQLFSFLIIAKHPHYHYLIPLYLGTGLNLVLLYETFRRQDAAVWAKGLTAAILGLSLVFGVANLSARIPTLYHDLRIAKNDQITLYERVKAKTRDVVRVDYYRSPSPEFALYFGNELSGGLFGRILEEKYSGVLFYNIWTAQFESFTNSIERSLVLAKYSHLYFFGNPYKYRSERNVTYFESSKLRDIDRQGDYALQEWLRP